MHEWELRFESLLFENESDCFSLKFGLITFWTEFNSLGNHWDKAMIKQIVSIGPWSGRGRKEERKWRNEGKNVKERLEGNCRAHLTKLVTWSKEGANVS